MTGIAISPFLRMLAAAVAVASSLGLPALAGDADNGRILYQGLCARCHGPVPVQRQSGANLVTADARLLRDTIANNPAMAFLGFLTDRQVDDLVAYLNQPESAPAPINYSDQWWNPAQDGWGISIIHHAASNLIFAVVFIYDDDRRPLWLALPGGRWSGNAYTGDLYRTSGTPFGTAYSAADLVVRRAGTATLTFHSATSATLDYEVGVRRVSTPIVRMPF
jgi:cytochrome c2